LGLSIIYCDDKRDFQDNILGIVLTFKNFRHLFSM